MISKPKPEGIAKKISKMLAGAQPEGPTDWEKLLPELYGPNAIDPDDGYGNNECDDFISKILAKYTGLGGAFSTWTERHAFIIGAQIGYLHVNKTEIVPVPVFCKNEPHHFFAGVIMGRAAKKFEDAAGSIDWKQAATAIGAAGAAGAVWGPQVIAFIKTMFGGV